MSAKGRRRRRRIGRETFAREGFRCLDDACAYGLTIKTSTVRSSCDVNGLVLVVYFSV